MDIVHFVLGILTSKVFHSHFYHDHMIFLCVRLVLLLAILNLRGGGWGGLNIGLSFNSSPYTTRTGSTMKWYLARFLRVYFFLFSCFIWLECSGLLFREPCASFFSLVPLGNLLVISVVSIFLQVVGFYPKFLCKFFYFYFTCK